MGWVAFIAVGLAAGLCVRTMVPGWKGATLRETAAMLAVATVGSVVAAIIGSALPIASAFLSAEPPVVASSLFGSAIATVLLGSPRGGLSFDAEER
jgi:hypothetical protein